MKKLLIIGLLIIVGIGLYFSQKNQENPLFFQEASNQPETQTSSTLETIATDLHTPWAIAFLPDQSMLVTERPGSVKHVTRDGQVQTVTTVQNVKQIGEGGLLGIALHPQFSSNNFVYLYYTYDASDQGSLNRVVRMRYENNQLQDEQIILDQIPGAVNHNGGRIKFGPDNFLYITAGDAQNPSQAQDQASLAGKILRVTDTGQLAPGNPFNNHIYSYGHRNPQGLAWDTTGNLWAVEHGNQKLDEINRIEMGKNYGWPDIEGDEASEDLQNPIVHSGNETWAPSGVAIVDNNLYFAGLRGQALFKLDLNNPQSQPVAKFKSELGRIREVIRGPDGMLYITTSNRDGRGIPKNGDDKIFKINPNLL